MTIYQNVSFLKLFRQKLLFFNKTQFLYFFHFSIYFSDFSINIPESSDNFFSAKLFIFPRFSLYLCESGPCVDNTVCSAVTLKHLVIYGCDLRAQLNMGCLWPPKYHWLPQMTSKIGMVYGRQNLFS